MEEIKKAIGTVDILCDVTEILEYLQKASFLLLHTRYSLRHPVIVIQSSSLERKSSPHTNPKSNTYHSNFIIQS
jgi:hypothetical protein